MPRGFDFSIKELESYTGTNPCPADFDAYWDAALAELDAIDPEVELIPAGVQSPFAECFDMYFTGVGGARVYAKLVKPLNADSPHPAVMQFHGYSGDSGDWVGKLPYAAAGITVASLDCRGQGGKSEDVGGVVGNTLRGHIIRGLDGPAENLLYRQIYLDTAQMTRIVMAMEDVDENRVGATGGSQGGGLTLACASLEPRIKKAAPIYPFLSDYKRVWDMELAKSAYQELEDYFRRFDPRHEREEEVFTKLGYISVHNLAPRIKAEVLMGTGLADRVCPPSTQYAAYNRITSSKEMVLYPDFGHENLPGFNDKVFEFMLEL